MYGDRDTPDREFACQSTGPRECSLPATRNSNDPVFSHVHLYFHGAGSSTKYSGTFRVEFFDSGGEAPRDSPVNITVSGEEKIGNHSVTGIVTPTPGRYRVVLRLAASKGSGENTMTINDEIPVEVR